MKNFINHFQSIVFCSVLLCFQSCQSTNQFTTAQETCFKNKLPINSTIKYGMATGNDNFQYPYIKKSLLNMPGATTFKDSMAFLSRDKEIRITHWKKFNFADNHKKFGEDQLMYGDLVKFNNYVAKQKMFIKDKSMRIKSNIMYNKCKYPHFVMQGETRKHYFFMKTELSGLPLIKNKVFKNCLIRFPKKLKTKYWGTVHQMLAKAGHIQIDNVKPK